MDEINTIEDFEKACAAHDLTHAYSDDHSVWRRGSADFDRIRKAAAKFDRGDVERIWNGICDQRLVEPYNKQFYWRESVWGDPAGDPATHVHARDLQEAAAVAAHQGHGIPAAELICSLLPAAPRMGQG